jgi:hypothetical protein
MDTLLSGVTRHSNFVKPAAQSVTSSNANILVISRNDSLRASILTIVLADGTIDLEPWKRCTKGLLGR